MWPERVADVVRVVGKSFLLQRAMQAGTLSLTLCESTPGCFPVDRGQCSSVAIDAKTRIRRTNCDKIL